LKENDSLLQSAACEAIALIGRVSPLPIVDNNDSLSKKSIVDSLLAIVKSNKATARLKERAIAACGYLCVGDNFAFAEFILKSFLDLSKEVSYIDSAVSCQWTLRLV